MNSQPQKSCLGFLKNGGVPADLSKLPRCTATAKHSGKRCKRIALKGKTVCQFHGGRGGGPKGKRNGSYKHGKHTKEAIAARQESNAALSVIRAHMCGYRLSKKTLEKGLKSIYRKKSGYQRKKPPSFVPKKKRKYFCVFQKGGPIWGIGWSKKNAIFDSYGYIEEDEFKLHNEEDYTDCPDGDYIVMRCSKGLYDAVNDEDGGVGYFVSCHAGAYRAGIRGNHTIKRA